MGHPSEKPSFGGPHSSPSFSLRGQSQFPDSLVEVLTWLWAAVWGREAGQMSRSPGEEAAPREGGQGFWPSKTTSSPSDLSLSVWSWGATTAQLNHVREAPALCVATDSAAASLIPPPVLLENNRTFIERAVPQVETRVCEAPAQCQAHCSCSINVSCCCLCKWEVGMSKGKTES